MNYELREGIKLSQVYLDPVNPRHDPLEAEAEIIKHLLSTEDVKPLARHIAIQGSLSPLELIALAPHPTVEGAFIPAEGNRRMCALKLLADPDRATTEADKRYFRTLREQMPKPIKSFRAIIFKTKKAARPWVSLRHEGLQGGVGTKSWSPGQKTRFNMDGVKPTNPNTQAVSLLDYAEQQGLITDAEKSLISITLLTRYLTNPVFRDAIGLANNRDLSISVPKSEFDHAVKRFLTDAMTPASGVSSRTAAADRKDYANKLREQGDAPVTRGQPPVDVSKATNSAPATKPTSPTTSVSPKRNNPSRDDDKYVIPRSFKANIQKNTVLKRVYDELYDLPADEFRFCAAYLTRAVIEQAATMYLRQKGKTPPRDLHSKLLELEKILETEKLPDNARKPLRTMGSNKDDRGSAETLGAFVHGGIIPSKHDAIRTWDDVQPALAHIFANLK
jgi:hypothetical protein